MHNYICMPTYEGPPRDKHVNPHSHPCIQPHSHSHAAAHAPACCRMSRACDEGSVSLSLSSPGMVITLGGVHKFRFNHPAEAAVLRERRRVGDDRLQIKTTLLIKMAVMVMPMMLRLLGGCGVGKCFVLSPVIFVYLCVSAKFNLFFFPPQASEGGMSCTYIDLCPLTPDNR